MHLVNEPRLAHLIVHSALDAVSGIGLTHHFPCCLQLVHRTFVHCDACTIEPSLGLEVGCKVLQERQDELAICLLLGLALHLLGAVGSAVVVVEHVVPGYESIAVNLLVDAEVHHELHPAVKHGVVILPGTVDLTHLGYHALKGVIGLAVPGMLDDGAGDDLLAGVGQKLHDGTHAVKVLLAPQRHVEVTGHCIGVLPEVEVEGPL